MNRAVRVHRLTDTGDDEGRKRAGFASLSLIVAEPLPRHSDVELDQAADDMATASEPARVQNELAQARKGQALVTCVLLVVCHSVLLLLLLPIRSHQR